MKNRAFLASVAACFLCFVLQLVAALAGPWAALAGGLAAGLGAWLWMRWLRVEPRWLAVVVAAAGSAIAVGAMLAADPQTEPWILTAPLIAAAAALGNLFRSRPKPRRCALCHQEARLLLACPRCRQEVCDRPECWEFTHQRCHRCAETGVRILKAEPAWWRSTFAEAPPGAPCRSCLTRDALFACPQCGAVECENCWDDLNGQCPRCYWFCRDLPAHLQSYLYKPGK